MSICCNHGNISTMYILRIQGLMTIPYIISHNALVIRIFLFITHSEFSPENFTKVTISDKIGMIYTFCPIFPLIMVLEPISFYIALGHHMPRLVTCLCAWRHTACPTEGCFQAHNVPGWEMPQGTYRSKGVR